MLGNRFEQVLSHAQRGDAQAFAELWRDANPMLLRYLHVTAGGLAEDIASHAWLKVIEALGSFTGDEPGFRRWLVTIARNQHLDQVRRAGRRPERLLAEMTDVADRSGGLAADAATEAEEVMSTRAALALIARLPPDQAEMVTLRVVMGLDVSDVAAVMGRSSGAVRVAVHRALRRLGEMVDGQGVPVTGSGASTFRDRDA